MSAWDHPLIRKGMPPQLAKRRARIAAGEKPLGWKVGLGAPAMMEKLGLQAPIVGYLMRNALIAPGGTLSIKGYVRPVAEAEIAVRMAATPKPGASADEVRAAIKEIMPAIEIADMDVLPTPDNLDVILEGDVFQRHVVVGDTARAGGSIEGLTSKVTRRGALINTTTDPEVLTGKVVDIVAHVAATLAAFGETLLPGDVIITGSITPPQMLENDDMDFGHTLDPIGAVSIAFRHD
ncbi:2-keto-4-pentenoate hydratase [Pseudolabrys sp. FHR47]|uniref:2-keto-4-pentenoate hydratase n=1 Tax=Pseudolabrys sp. FHR47 TaxID=2562284 RepID=UPI0010BEA8EE|nr:fumarylacetoacetate hydrolase family protein [Pseudolabrys sp. FHR47]